MGACRPWGCSIAGRTSVPKTQGRGFQSLHSCQSRRKKGAASLPKRKERWEIGTGGLCGRKVMAAPDRSEGRRGLFCVFERRRGQSAWRRSIRANSSGRSAPKDRTSVVEGKSVTVRVDLGGRRNIKK